jgi:hypothetical protein
MKKSQPAKMWIGAGVIAVVLCGVAVAQQMHLPWQTGNQNSNTPKQSVEFLYPLQLKLPAGKPTEVALHFRVLPGLHINAHVPSDKSYIPTTLVLPAGSSVKVSSVVFPAGQPFAFKAFPQDKLSVYEGEFTVHAKITATRGDHLLNAALRYQACDANTNSCYPPRKAPVAIDILGD